LDRIGLLKVSWTKPLTRLVLTRQAAVLRRVAEKAGWGEPLPNSVGLGVASTFGQERAMPTWVACAARVRVDRDTGYVTVEKLTLVIDAGTIVQPNSVAAQVEGAALWGMSMARYLVRSCWGNTQEPVNEEPIR
jgi:CO/xanthine dehydrogenase Mo-binding subunit